MINCFFVNKPIKYQVCNCVKSNFLVQVKNVLLKMFEEIKIEI